MVDSAQLPHLVALFDDESESVRRAVLEALASFGDALEPSLSSLTDAPDARRRQEILDRVAEHRAELSPKPPLFEAGHRVRHRRYDYLGLVVAVDLEFSGDEDWYRANRTQPPRQQPWYFVLVHGGPQVTYAAETSLMSDAGDESLEHPLIEVFFERAPDGSFRRNQRPWTS